MIFLGCSYTENEKKSKQKKFNSMWCFCVSREIKIEKKTNYTAHFTVTGTNGSWAQDGQEVVQKEMLF